MKTKNFFKTTFIIIIIIKSLMLSSCSNSICSAYARSNDRVYSAKKKHNQNKGAYAISSPGSVNGSVRLQQRYTSMR